MVKQMPDPNRATLIYMLRFLSDVAHYDAFNQTSTRLLAQVFSQPLMRRQTAGFPQLKEAQDKVMILKLMIEAHSEIAEACAPPPTTGVRSRAARAGIVPGTPLVVDPTPSPDPKFSRALSSSSPQPATAYQEMVHALPPVFDEGMAAVKQLAASNEALTLLLGRVDAELAGLRWHIAPPHTQHIPSFAPNPSLLTSLSPWHCPKIVTQPKPRFGLLQGRECEKCQGANGSKREDGRAG